MDEYKKARGLGTDYSARDKIAVLYAEGDIVDGSTAEGVIGEENMPGNCVRSASMTKSKPSFYG